MANTKPKQTPALATVILQRDLDGKDLMNIGSTGSVIGKLNFLEKSTRPDIAYAVHLRFSANPKKSHARAMLFIHSGVLFIHSGGLVSVNAAMYVFDASSFCNAPIGIDVFI